MKYRSSFDHGYVSASCFFIAVRILVSLEHGHAASLHEPIISEKTIQGHQVFFEVEPLRFPPVSSKYDDVLQFSSVLRIGNSSFDKRPKLHREPTYHLRHNGASVSLRSSVGKSFLWNVPEGDVGRWEVKAEFVAGTANLDPGQYLLSLQVEFPELWPSSLSPRDSITTEVQEPSFILTVTWPVRLLTSPSHWEYRATSIAPLAPDAILVRNHIPIGGFERYQGRGGVNSSTSRDRWSEMSTRMALISQDGNTDSESDTTATNLAYMIDSMSPRSIVHLADGAVPKVDPAVRANACDIGEVLEMVGFNSWSQQMGLYLGNIKLHSWDCPLVNTAGFLAQNQILQNMWEWNEDFRPIRPHHLRNRVHPEMLLVDTDADRSFHEIYALLERWDGLLSDRATIIVRLLHGSCNGCEAARALYDFASQSRDEASNARLVHPWIPISNSVESDQMFILWRDRHIQGWDTAKAMPCWGCNLPLRHTVGGKWDVPGVYINVNEKRDRIMQERIQNFAPKATFNRFQGKLGSHERVCRDVGDTVGYVGISPSTVCVLVSHWLAIHSFFQENDDSSDYFLIAEDDITFDLVPFWPGPLSELLEIASASYPDWQVLNLAPSNWCNATPWIMRSYFHEYNLDGGRHELYWGAILYAIKRSKELAEFAASVHDCVKSEVLWRSSRCRTLLHTHADISIYNFVANTMANHVWTPNTNANPDTGLVLAFEGSNYSRPALKVPLVRVSSQESLRDPGGVLDILYERRGVEHLEAWQYAAFLHQMIYPNREPGEAIAE